MTFVGRWPLKLPLRFLRDELRLAFIDNYSQVSLCTGLTVVGLCKMCIHLSLHVYGHLLESYSLVIGDNFTELNAIRSLWCYVRVNL